MENLDGTIVTTSASQIADDLHVSVPQVGLVVTAYLVTLAVFIPLSGWLVTRFGTRVVFLSAIAIFTAASLLCATSVGLGQLVTMRVLQGIGGAMMVPVGRLAVLAKAAKADIMQLISYIVWPALVAPVIAPLAGGVITTYAGWRWLFVINIPLGVIAFAAALTLVPATATSDPPPLDWLGAALTCLGLGGLTAAASLLSASDPAWPAFGVVAGFSVLSLVTTAVHLLRTDHPLIDLTSLRIHTFRVSVGTGSLFMLGLGAVPFLLPLLFEDVYHWSAIKAGAVVLFLFAGNIGIKPATGFLLRRFSFRDVLVVSGLGLAATMIVFGLIARSTPLVIIVVVAVASGVFRSVGGTAYNTLSFSDVPERQMVHANSVAATMQQLSLGLGVAIATIALRIGDSTGHVLPGAVTASDRYTVAFLILTVLPLAAAGGAIRLSGDAGAATRSR